MKRVGLLIYLFYLNKTINCHVINLAIPLENVTQNLGLKDVNNLDDMEIVSEKQQGYFEDVLLLLSHQNWTMEEEACANEIERMVVGLRNFTLWSVWEWDSQSSAPQGVLFGSKYQLGNFDQCMNPPWSELHKNLQMKYCLADIFLEINDSKIHDNSTPVSPYQSALEFMKNRPTHARPLNELTWGVCAPASCPSTSIQKLLEIMLSRSHLAASGIKHKIDVAKRCQIAGENKEFDGLFYAFVGLVSSLTLICIVCTYYNSEQLSTVSIRANVIRAFCLKENGRNLLKMKRDGLEFFYGIKWLTMFFITLNHLAGIYNSGPISDGLTSDQAIQTMLGYFIVHTDLFVDTFFFLSGFLTFSAFAILIVVILYVCAVQSYTGNGPLWNRLVDFEVEVCRRNWWLNILMINNYVDTKNMCLLVSWYIPCDFHFFVVTLFLFFIYKKYPKMGVIAVIIIFVIALCIPGIITYKDKLAAVQDFTYEFLINPRASEDLHILYIKSHARYGSYLVGVLHGFVYVKHKSEDKLKTISKKMSIIGAIFGLTIMLAVMTYGGTFMWREYQPVESALYAALNRPAWACGLGLLVMSCSFGKTPIVNSILTWYPWVPLSRLTYGIYFTHTIIIARNVFIARNPQHNDYFKIIIDGAGTIFSACIFALLLWLLAEAPVNKLFDICLKSLVKPKNPEMEEELKNISDRK